MSAAAAPPPAGPAPAPTAAPRVSFHFNVPDKTAYACRLLRKAWAAHARVAVLGEARALAALDQALWTFDARSFIAHCLDSAPAHVQQASPILLTAEPDRLTPGAIVLNLSQPVHERFTREMGRFERLIELVGVDAQDRAQARQRWSHYKAAGLEPEGHDAAAKR